MSELTTMTKEEALARGCMYVPVIKAELTMEAIRGVEYITPLGCSDKMVLEGRSEGYAELYNRLTRYSHPYVTAKDNDMINDQAVEEYHDSNMSMYVARWINSIVTSLKNDVEDSEEINEMIFKRNTFEVKYTLSLKIVDRKIYAKNIAERMMVIPE